MNNTKKPAPKETPQKDTNKVLKEAPKKTTKDVVLKMDVSVHYDNKIHKKVMEALSIDISGFESINVNKKNKVITLRGDVDAFKLEKKLKKACDGLIKIDYFGPPREVEKPEVQNSKTTKELVLKMDASIHYDDKIHKKVMEALSVDISGFESINVNKKNKAITLRGDVKAGELENKLKKACDGLIKIDYFGPPREVEKPEVQNLKTTKELVLKMDASVHYDDKIHKKVMETLSVLDISGVESINVNMKNKVITARGDVKAGELEKKLKKACDGHIKIDYVGSPREVKKSEVKKQEVQNPGVVGVVMKVFIAMFSK